MFTIDFGNFSPVGKRLALAVSGGRDSMAMLRWFCDHASEYDFFVINLEHGIRGESSVADSRFVADYCGSAGVRCVSVAVDVPSVKSRCGGTAEEVARELRYEVFENLLAQGEADAVLLAHNADDQAETVLMRILRGTGVGGLSGMSAVRDGKYVRPILNVTRAEIDRYVEENNIPYVDDETNFDNDYTRNYLRNTLLPELKRRFPEVERSLARLARNASEAQAFVALYAPKSTAENGALVFDTSDLLEAAPSKLALLGAMKRLGAVRDVEETHLDALLRLAQGETGKRLDLPFGIEARKEYGKLYLAKKQDKPVEFELPIPNTTDEWNALVLDSSLGAVRFRLEKRASAKSALPNTLTLDMSCVPTSAVLRTRKNGDYIAKFGGGTVSLSDYLIDKKIPQRLRDGLVLLADGSCVLTVAGVDISRSVKVTDNTETILYVTTEDHK